MWARATTLINASRFQVNKKGSKMKSFLITGILLLTASYSIAQETSLPRPHLEQALLPTNVSIYTPGGSGATCYMLMTSPNAFDRDNTVPYEIQFAFSNSPGWTGSKSSYDGPMESPGRPPRNNVVKSSCTKSGVCISNILSGDFVVPDKNHYFAVRLVEVGNPSNKSAWSNEIECRPPAGP